VPLLKLNSLFASLFSLAVCLWIIPTHSVVAGTAIDGDLRSPHPSDVAYVGLHGMLMFGSAETLYAAHLPMFHPPHNVQVITRFTFEQPDVAAWIKARVAGSDNQPLSLWTLVPRHFDLLRLDPTHIDTVQHLVVDVYSGHFERGGERVFEGQSIRIESIELFNRLPLAARVSPPIHQKTEMQYCWLSAGSSTNTHFLFKQLGVRPEADHIVRIDGFLNTVSGCLSLPQPTDRLFATDDELRRVLESRYGRGSMSADIELRSLYLETTELR